MIDIQFSPKQYWSSNIKKTVKLIANAQFFKLWQVVLTFTAKNIEILEFYQPKQEN